MKLDKDTVIKHQFWFLLGTFVLVWVIAAFWLKVAAAKPIEDAQKAYKAADAKLKKASQGPKNPDTFCPPWQEYSKVIDQHKQVIWGQAWAIQKDMYDWPKGLTNSDMSTPQTELTPDERALQTRSLSQRDQRIERLRRRGQEKFLGLLGPVELAGGFDKIFNPLKLDTTPTREECWLAQEDFWVKRELFWDLSNAIANQSYMYPVGIDDKKEPMPAGVHSRYRFRNQNWELTLLIKPKGNELVISGDSTIRNIQPSQHVQSLTSVKGTGIAFNISQDGTSTSFEVRGEPVPWNEAQKLSQEDYPEMPSPNWKKAKEAQAKAAKTKEATEHLVGVSQAFDWSTCPIRRIDALVIGQQSCRTFTSPLQPNETLAKLDAPKEDPADAAKEKVAPTTGGPGMPGMPGMGATGSPMMGGNGPMAPNGMPGQKGIVAGNTTPNNSIERNRYLQAPKKKEDTAPTGSNEAEKPSRHLPLALQLIVDQAHLSDVLVALANSRLRIQITQVEFHRVKDIKQGDADNNGGTEMLRTGPVAMRGMYSGSSMGSYMRGMNPGGGMGPNTKAMYPGGTGMPPRPGSGPSALQGGMGMGPSRMSGSPMMMMGMYGKGKPFGPPGMMTPSVNPMKSPQVGPSTTSASDTKKTAGDDNLVEMTVYGVATLYRHPDPPKTDPSAAPSGPSTPTTPAAPGGAGR